MTVLLNSSARPVNTARNRHPWGSPRADRPNPAAGYRSATALQRNGNWHSAALTFDGEVIILGWEPGGSQPECEATDPDVKKSWFFYDSNTGAKLGQLVLPRPQTAAEDCTIHNYNVVPLRNKGGKPRYVLVGGNYQAGISVVDFTNPAAAKEIAYADPPPLVPTQLGGDWSTYWYNGRICEARTRARGRPRGDLSLDNQGKEGKDFRGQAGTWGKLRRIIRARCWPYGGPSAAPGELQVCA